MDGVNCQRTQKLKGAEITKFARPQVLIFTALAELSTRQIAETGQKVISDSNFLQTQRKAKQITNKKD